MIFLKLLHPKKAYSPILSTLLGISIEVKLLLPKDASPMVVTLSGIKYDPFLPAGYWTSKVVSLLNKTPSTAQYRGLSEATLIVDNLGQYAKTPSSMFVMLFGISIDVKLRQYQKASYPMLVTLLGNSIEGRLLQ